MLLKDAQILRYRIGLTWSGLLLSSGRLITIFLIFIQSELIFILINTQNHELLIFKYLNSLTFYATILQHHRILFFDLIFCLPLLEESLNCYWTHKEMSSISDSLYCFTFLNNFQIWPYLVSQNNQRFHPLQNQINQLIFILYIMLVLVHMCYSIFSIYFLIIIFSIFEFLSASVPTTVDFQLRHLDNLSVQGCDIFCLFMAFCIILFQKVKYEEFQVYLTFTFFPLKIAFAFIFQLVYMAIFSLNFLQASSIFKMMAAYSSPFDQIFLIYQA